MTAASEITVDHLINKGLIHPETAEKHRAKRSRHDEILAGMRGTETDSTTLITMSDGPLEKAIVGALCDAAGIPGTARDGIRLLSGSEFRVDSGAKDRRTIDIIGARRLDEAVTVKAWHPVFATEAKYDAWVNGGHGYCKAAKESYSNQAICYLHGCIDARLGEDVKFIWLGNATAHPEFGPWGRKGIHEGDFKWAGLEEAFRLQEIAKERWSSLTWAEVGEAITVALAAEGLADEAAAIVRFLRAGGPSSN
ncbi:hypothetical protein Achl_4457 (plasmid) [Pseudarthrobacter chlorophenolicus A6]|uniref:Uncharacterized protein n=1 Tax=Pseudarthrobacter chlorophenolicus (strain ATCC 700700 / DSM 12829 / CIP 107037 / JCM 12360 / KCTC 9906 / NCIMB 13794 / A6) TaxID=452863 RepID=B8HJ11_PSECP|nr:hypothetical protein [Pseudarthrobacter chlorophenolicus]ACL42408.1 hypothetical protein Achl_4457 [Pseudarthrobacter chlorophenolicus A6]SDQ17726.1 hypothetical protein SAMN04489738_0514 [Pseudarthrobacter chlorophenolicus]